MYSSSGAIGVVSSFLVGNKETCVEAGEAKGSLGMVRGRRVASRQLPSELVAPFAVGAIYEAAWCALGAA